MIGALVVAGSKTVVLAIVLEAMLALVCSTNGNVCGNGAMASRIPIDVDAAAFIAGDRAACPTCSRLVRKPISPGVVGNAAVAALKVVIPRSVEIVTICEPDALRLAIQPAALVPSQT